MVTTQNANFNNNKNYTHIFWTIYIVSSPNGHCTENTKVYKNPSTEVYPCYTFVEVYKYAFAPLLLW